MKFVIYLCVFLIVLTGCQNKLIQIEECQLKPSSEKLIIEREVAPPRKYVPLTGHDIKFLSVFFKKQKYIESIEEAFYFPTGGTYIDIKYTAEIYKGNKIFRNRHIKFDLPYKLSSKPEESYSYFFYDQELDFKIDISQDINQNAVKKIFTDIFQSKVTIIDPNDNKTIIINKHKWYLYKIDERHYKLRSFGIPPYAYGLIIDIEFKGNKYVPTKVVTLNV